MDHSIVLRDIRRDENRHPMTTVLLAGKDYPDVGAVRPYPEAVGVKIGRPARETPDGDYYCPVDIIHDDGSLRFPTVAFGATEVQALHLALDAVTMALRSLTD